jgi:Holliday junction DNA helicase RuvA
MYNYIRGTLTEKDAASATVEAGGVGYLLQIPLSTYESLPAIGDEVKLLAHLVVREDSHSMIGFATSRERELFRELIGVTAIGPKVALNILSKITVADFVRAIATGDVTRLKSISGVGAKTAERLVIELKGKLKAVDASSASAGSKAAPAGPRSTGASVKQEAFDALMTLGYVDKQVSKALERVEATVAADAPIEEWIRKALQVI